MKKLSLLCLLSVLFMSFRGPENHLKEEAKVVLSNFDQASFSINLSEFEYIFLEILNFGEEDHHSCQGAAGGLTCTANCQDGMNCVCSTGQYWWGGYYCTCYCQGGGTN